jgi:hypothetical protein
VIPQEDPIPPGPLGLIGQLGQQAGIGERAAVGEIDSKVHGAPFDSKKMGVECGSCIILGVAGVFARNWGQECSVLVFSITQAGVQ